MTITYGWFLSTFPASSRLIVVNDDVIVNARALADMRLPSAERAWTAGVKSARDQLHFK